MGKPKFQFVSDLHLEVGGQYESFEFPCSAPYLILAGDIGRLVDYDRYFGFLQRHCQRFTQVFLVLGNHEFYGTTRESGLESASKLASSIQNLVLLQRNALEVNGVLVVGCMLGSWIPDEASTIVSQKVNDFRRIMDWTVAKHNATYLEDLAWLKKEISTTNASKILVVTHYAPESSQTSAPDKVNSLIASAFATDLLSEENPEFRRVSTWVFGHTHYTTDIMVNDVRIVSNQRGYAIPGSESKTSWSITGQWEKLRGRSNPKTYDIRRTITL